MLATSGPGATNLTTGIATAYYDSSPVVFLTVNVPEPLIGKDTFQEVDITGITMPITKANFLVRDAASLADTLRTAFAIARSGRPGPVLIDILKNVTAEEVDYKFLPLSEHVNHGRLKEMMDIASHDLTSREREPDQEDVDKLLEMIEHAQKPVVLCGGGVIRSEGAVPEFRKFFQTLNTPGDLHHDGRRRVPRQPSPVCRHGGHARHPCGQHRRIPLRPADRRGLPLLRPRGLVTSSFCSQRQNRTY